MPEDDLKAGYTVVYRATILNDSDGSGDVTVLVVPGDGGNEFEIQSIMLFNQDTTTRTLQAIIEDDGGNDMDFLLNEGPSGGNFASWPHEGDRGSSTPTGPGRRLVSGEMQLRLQGLAVAASQDVAFALVLRVHGSMPTFTETGQGTTPTITVDTEKPE